MKATFDSDGYPTKETLITISSWYSKNKFSPEEFFSFAEKCFNKHYGVWQEKSNYETLISYNCQKFDALLVATGGWSANEAVLSAMSKDVHFNIAWVASIKGGLFIFDLSRIRVQEDAKKVLTSSKKGS